MKYVPQIQYKTKVLMDVPILFKSALVARAIQSAEYRNTQLKYIAKRKCIPHVQVQKSCCNCGSDRIEICSSSAQSADAIRQSVRAGSQTSDQARAPTTGTIFFPFRFFLPGTFSIGTFFGESVSKIVLCFLLSPGYDHRILCCSVNPIIR